LRLKSVTDRSAAAGALWKIDPERTPVAVRAFIEILEEGDDFSTWWVAMAIGEIGPPARDAFPLLLAASKSEDGMVREAATWALARIRQQ
jgi:HEAT repeat protein